MTPRKFQIPDWNLPLTRQLRPVYRTTPVTLTTLHDAAAFILELPAREHNRPAWIEPALALLAAATSGAAADIATATDQVETSLRANGYLLGPKRPKR